jgi:hypothetical protein
MRSELAVRSSKQQSTAPKRMVKTDISTPATLRVTMLARAPARIAVRPVATMHRPLQQFDARIHRSTVFTSLFFRLCGDYGRREGSGGGG